MAVHTPGPWTCDTGFAEANDGIGVVVRAGRLTVARLRPKGIIGAEMIANARLIAAAPNLLDALVRVLDATKDADGARDGSALRQHALAVIASAIRGVR